MKTVFLTTVYNDTYLFLSAGCLNTAKSDCVAHFMYSRLVSKYSFTSTPTLKLERWKNHTILHWAQKKTSVRLGSLTLYFHVYVSPTQNMVNILIEFLVVVVVVCLFVFAFVLFCFCLVVLFFA